MFVSRASMRRGLWEENHMATTKQPISFHEIHGSQIQSGLICLRSAQHSTNSTVADCRSRICTLPRLTFYHMVQTTTILTSSFENRQMKRCKSFSKKRNSQMCRSLSA